LIENLLKENFVKIIRLHDQRLIKVCIPGYLLAVNSKTNKMAELDIDSEKMF
jgi:hypothetical protein